MKSRQTQQADLIRIDVPVTVPAACCVMWQTALPMAFSQWHSAAWQMAHQQVEADARRARLLGHVQPSLN